MASYDEQIKTYDHDVTQNAWKSPYYTADAVRRHIPDNKNAHILDVCGGTGQVAQELHKMGYSNIDYLDGSSEMTREAIKRNLYNTYIRQIIPENGSTIVRSDVYDATTISGGHITNGKIDDMLRVTKKGGIFVAGIVETTEVDHKEFLKVLDHFKQLGKRNCSIIEHTETSDMIMRGDGSLAPGHVIVVRKA